MVAFKALDGSWQWTNREWSEEQIRVIKKHVKPESIKVVVV
jgi:hypothetical protein